MNSHNECQSGNPGDRVVREPMQLLRIVINLSGARVVAHFETADGRFRPSWPLPVLAYVLDGR